MIVEALVHVLGGFVSFVGDLFGTIPVPSWLNAIPGAMEDLAGYANGLGAFVPLADAANALTLVMAAVGLGFLIKVVRIVASFFTAGGGSAA